MNNHKYKSFVILKGRYMVLADLDDLVELNDKFTNAGYKLVFCGECDPLVQVKYGYEYEFIAGYMKEDLFPKQTI